MNLKSLIDHDYTDKDQQAGHSYLELYDIFFEPIQTNALNVLEVGIDKGGSIKLWRDYFTNEKTTIYGIDSSGEYQINRELLYRLKADDRVKLLTTTDAYDPGTVINFHLSNTKFDVIIDDGPHTVRSQKAFIEYYAMLLSESGILIVEDIQNINTINELFDVVPDDLKRYVQVYDLRNAINQYDDVLFVINKISPMCVSQIYDGRIVPISTGKFMYGKFIKNTE